MTGIFPTSSPEAQGVPSDALLRFQQALDGHGVPLHSALVMRFGHLLMETYAPPYNAHEPHRMFSVTKSFVSLAIGLLEADGQLSLEDRIAAFFADMLQGRQLHPYVMQATIRDLLRMASPHAASAYKLVQCEDWVEAFFVCPPSHRPGTCFAYDTSATHVLCALVERLTGQPLLDYLRGKCLNEIGFGKEAYCLKDAFGRSMGGSGLMASPYDLLRVARLMQRKGAWEGKQLLPRDYVEAATSFQIDNYLKPGASQFEETQGYGYQFWRVRNGGFACFGMGGQLAICMPDKDLLLVTTADTQDIPGGVQRIYDAFFSEVWPRLSDTPLPENERAHAELDAYSRNRRLPFVPGAAQSPLLPGINGARYVLDPNAMGFSSVALTLNADRGELVWEKQNHCFTLPFSVGDNTITPFPDRGFRCAASGAFRTESTFVVRAQLIDTCIGSIAFELAYDGPFVTLLLRKVEETMFTEYNGFVSGRKEECL